MPGPGRLTRRSFLRSSLAAAAGVMIVPRRVLGGDGYQAPSDEITRAVIGVGGMGLEHLKYPGARTIAVCDVDAGHLANALASVGPGVRGYHDFRDVLARPDLDVVHIATPPHWHAQMAVAAVEAGKDVWCEKPMTRTIGEGLRVVEAVRRTGRMFRINTWFRFEGVFYGFGLPLKPVKKAVRAGLLGWPLKATVNAATGFDWKFTWSGKTYLPPREVPRELDYDFWLGPAPFKPYHPHRVHQTFRGYWDYDGGGLGDMGMHYLDPVQDLLDKDRTSPVEISADAPQQHPDACGSWRRVAMKYADGCEIVLDGGNCDAAAAFLEGPRGRIFPDLRSDIPDLVDSIAGLPDPDEGVTDFYASVRNRRKFVLNEENAHRSCTLVNLAKIAVRLNRPLRFDPETQRFPGDDEANRMVDEPVRAPWRQEGAGR